MSFFNSDIVRAEMTEIQELQEEIYEQVMKFPYMDNANKAYHIDLLDYCLGHFQELPDILLSGHFQQQSVE